MPDIKHGQIYKDILGKCASGGRRGEGVSIRYTNQ